MANDRDLVPRLPVLIVDDEELFLRSLTLMLRSEGITNILACDSGTAARSLLATRQFSIVLLDINLPDIRGVDLMEACVQNSPETPVVMVTAINDAAIAVECMKMGALDYLIKPIDVHRLLALIRNVTAQRDVSLENESLKAYLLDGSLKYPEAFDGIVTGNQRMRALFRYVEAIAATPFPVLITGETGTGKELFANAIHRLSGKKGALVTVNVAGIDDNAFSDTLFGHVRGAFTGAERTRAGLIEQAAGGTLFLDEIGDLQTVSQTRLLRVIQNRDYLPLGSDVARLADVRLLVATNKSIDALRCSPDFRVDFYHRLKTHHIAVPPLRERREDIPLLLDYFCGEAAGILNKPKPSIPRGLLRHLANYDFPGNVRELRSMVFEAASVAQTDTLPLGPFRGMIGSPEEEFRQSGDQEPEGGDLRFPQQLPTIRATTRALIAEAMRRACGNQKAAASLLGITPQALSRRLKHSTRKRAETSTGPA